VDGLRAAGVAEAVGVLRQAGARFAYLHGSRAAGRERPDSDVDIAAHFGGRAPNSFDVLLPAGVDLLVLDGAPLELAGRVAAGGRLLFDDEPVARVRWEAVTRKVYFDELPRITRAHHEFAAVVTARAGDQVAGGERILRLLRSITEDLAVLKGESGAGEGRREDPMWLRGVKYTFVTVIEACVDVAQHLCATGGWGPPADNGDAVRLLGVHEVCAPGLARSIRQAVSFRDALVHDCTKVDGGIVLGRLEVLGDLEDFVSQVAAFVITA
jgi:uncharacterized protein YutE (UPF0331/DUF86 family)/predicted nucleotidyltransferase